MRIVPGKDMSWELGYNDGYRIAKETIDKLSVSLADDFEIDLSHCNLKEKGSIYTCGFHEGVIAARMDSNKKNNHGIQNN